MDFGKTGQSEANLLREVLKDIIQLSADCRSDMQGRLADEEHKRAFAVLGSIHHRASMAIEGRY